MHVHPGQAGAVLLDPAGGAGETEDFAQAAVADIVPGAEIGRVKAIQQLHQFGFVGYGLPRGEILDGESHTMFLTERHERVEAGRDAFEADGGQFLAFHEQLGSYLFVARRKLLAIGIQPQQVRGAMAHGDAAGMDHDHVGAHLGGKLDRVADVEDGAVACALLARTHQKEFGVTVRGPDRGGAVVVDAVDLDRTFVDTCAHTGHLVDAQVVSQLDGIHAQREYIVDHAFTRLVPSGVPVG